MQAAGLKVTVPNDLEIVMTRTFNAPRVLVWDAMTKPDLMKRWMFMPPGWSWTRCDVELRVGGKYRWEWAGPDGRHAMTISGMHKVVTPHSKIVHTELMEMGPGAGPCGPEGSQADPWELLATLELTESGGQTHLKMTLSFPTKQGRDEALASGMEQGMEAGYKNLDAHFAKQARR